MTVAGDRLGPARGLLRAGRLAEAEAACRDMLTRSPGAPDIRTLLADILVRRGEPARALVLYDQVVQAGPAAAAVWVNRGIALQRLDRPDAALASLDQALAIAPDAVAALANKAALLKNLGRPAEALAAADAALSLTPDSAELLANRSAILERLGRLPEALKDLDQADSRQPPSLSSRVLRGRLLARLDRPADALAAFEAVLAVAPDNHEAALRRMALLARLGRPEAVVVAADAILARQPLAAPFLARSAAKLALQDFEGALADAEAAGALEPGSVDPILATARALRYLGRHGEAENTLDRAGAIAPASAVLRSERGLILHATQQFAAARNEMRAARALMPESREIRSNLGICELLLGNYEQGWALYESREMPRPPFPDRMVPRWTGREDLRGKTILLQCEQGLGDTIQFSRFAARVRARGARVLLRVQPALKRLLESLDGPDAVLAMGDPLPHCDFHCPLMSLPHALGITLATVPAARSYLAAAPADVAAWRARLPRDGRPTIGIVWSGNSRYGNDRIRSVPLQALLPLLDLDARIVSLQKDVRAVDRAILMAEPRITHFGDDLRDFSDTAGLVASLELVISVDTAVCHLAAALGRPTSILLPATPCWRWLLDRSDSPYYPTARLFRQTRPGNWDSVVENLRGAFRSITNMKP